ncbi:MAG: HD domain-containing phosphohydrolase [Thermodesulfobacteriota bacterium]
MTSLNTRRFPFYISITTLVVAIVVALTGVFLWINEKESSAVALDLADRFFSEVNEKVSERYENALESVAVLVGSASLMPAMAEKPIHEGLSHSGLDFMVKALKHFEFLHSLYTGYHDGSFMHVTASRGQAAINTSLAAPENTWFVVHTIIRVTDGASRQFWSFLDQEGELIFVRLEFNPSYDPRERPWYRKALESDQAVYTAPYVFSTSKLPGITCAEQLDEKGGVFGADITLERFSESFARQRISKNSLLFLFDRDGRVLAHPTEKTIKTIITKKGDIAMEEVRFLKGKESQDPLLKAVIDSYASSTGLPIEKTEILSIQGKPYLVRLSTMDQRLGFDEVIGSVAPLSDFTGHIQRMQTRISLLSLAVLVIAIVLVLLLSRRLSGSMIRLGKEAAKIQQFDFSETPPFDSVIKEMHSLIHAFRLMKATIRQRTDVLIATQGKLEQLVKSGIALSAEQDMTKLLDQIFVSARELSRAESGSLYLRGQDDVLRFEIMQTGSQETRHAGDLNQGTTFADVPLYDADQGVENHMHVASHAVLTGDTIIIDNISRNEQFDFSNECRLNELSDSECISFMGVPLKTRQGKTIGVLQLFNARMEDMEAVIPFEGESVRFVESLAAQAAIALNNQQLLEAQRNLFNALIQMLAGAIDAKSPYTGGHCARVPEVATLLAQAASDKCEGPFAGYRLDTEDAWREFQVASWLHDCGKVTTPEYVVDKATKLETIYNRIHEIRTRFEILWRDAEIEYLRKQLEDTHLEADLQAKLKEEQGWIRDAFAFVAQCNVGGEFMADEKVERLQEIAQRTWVRHLDDRLGLSQEEDARMSTEPARALPAKENLIADKPFHVIPRDVKDPFDGNPYGFKMDLPEHLYNHGELYNLAIRKGTLTDEERFKINEHITQTIIMLNKLPFPDYLVQVPEFAGAHHETMIGTGYPKRLQKEEMSIPARIMAIADIFEALTAADRPYKKAKTLSEALRIMSFMRNDQHIDAELFDLFLKSGVYLQYAEIFLAPSQLDEVDIQDYLQASP